MGHYLIKWWLIHPWHLILINIVEDNVGHILSIPTFFFLIKTPQLNANIRMISNFFIADFCFENGLN